MQSAAMYKWLYRRGKIRDTPWAPRGDGSIAAAMQIVGSNVGAGPIGARWRSWDVHGKTPWKIKRIASSCSLMQRDAWCPQRDSNSQGPIPSPRRSPRQTRIRAMSRNSPSVPCTRFALIGGLRRVSW